MFEDRSRMTRCGVRSSPSSSARPKRRSRGIQGGCRRVAMSLDRGPLKPPRAKLQTLVPNRKFSTSDPKSSQNMEETGPSFERSVFKSFQRLAPGGVAHQTGLWAQLHAVPVVFCAASLVWPFGPYISGIWIEKLLRETSRSPAETSSLLNNHMAHRSRACQRFSSTHSRCNITKCTKHLRFDLLGRKTRPVSEGH